MLKERLIWLSVIISTVIYGFMAWRAIGAPPADLRREVLTPFMLALYAVALTTYVTAFLFSGVLRRKGAPRQTALTVKLMMLDAVAIFGLAGAFVAHDWRLYVPTWALASVGLLRSFPLESPSS